MKNEFFTMLSFLFLCISVNGQTDPSERIERNGIGLLIHRGFIIIHSRDIRPVADSYPFGITLDFSRHYTDRETWSKCRCFPRAGVQLSWFNFDNTAILGHGVILAPYIEPFFGKPAGFALSFKASAGLTWLSKPWHEKDNPDNFSYSMAISGYLQLGLNLNYFYRQNWNLKLSINYNHISNGGLKEPNKGINYPTMSLGFEYFPDEMKFREFGIAKEEREYDEGRYDLSIFGTSGIYKKGDKERHAIFGFSFIYSRRYNRLHSFFGEIEWINNGLAREKMLREEGQVVDHNRMGIIGGHEYILGSFIFSQGLGIHIYRPYSDSEIIYQRWRLVYRFTEKVSAGIGLKSHRHIADFLDFRVVWSF